MHGATEGTDKKRPFNVPRKLSLRLTRNTVIAALALGIVLNLGLVAQDYVNAQRDMDEDINALIEISHSPASQIAYNIDTRLAEELLEGLVRHPAIIDADIQDPDGRFLAQRTRDLPDQRYRWLSDWLFDATRDYSAELQVRHLEDVELGQLRMTVDTYHYGYAFLERASYTILSGFIKSLALAGLLLVIFYFMLTKPLHRVIYGLAGVDAEKAEKARLPTPLKHEDDEIGFLVEMTNRHLDAIDHSLQQLRAAEGQLKEYNESLTQLVEARTGEIQEKNKALERSNTALMHAKEDALERARARADFLASMSHEIRTPLNGLLGMLTLILDGDINPAQRSRVEIALSAGNSMLSLVNDILDISKVEAGKLSLEHIPFDLGSMAEECALLFAEQGRQNHIDVITRIDTSLPGAFRGDPTRTRQIINNLLGNAIKFTSEGFVRLDLEQHNGYTRIVVKDTGIGMSREAQESIFSPFSQGDSDTTRRFGGTGLGLTLCQQLVERMGGTIIVDSSENHGTTFTVNLPLDIVSRDNFSRGADALDGEPVILLTPNDHPHLEPLTLYLTHWGMEVTGFNAASVPKDGLNQSRPLVIADRTSTAIEQALVRLPKESIIVSLGHNPGEPEQDPDLTVDLPLVRQQLARTLRIRLGLEKLRYSEAPADDTRHQNLRILLVEDNRVNQLVASGMLRKLGHRVDLAENGERALLALEKNQYDLVLMDCQMPVMDGYEATHRIREQERFRHLPIIAVTANVMQGDRQACLNAGMNDYITKPYSREQLAETIRRWAPPA